MENVIPPPIPAKIDVAKQPMQETQEEDDEEKLGILPFTHTFNIINNKYILKLAANKNKCVIYVTLEDPLDKYYYFTELTKEELIDINKIFSNFVDIKEVIDFLKICSKIKVTMRKRQKENLILAVTAKFLRSNLM